MKMLLSRKNANFICLLWPFLLASQEIASSKGSDLRSRLIIIDGFEGHKKTGEFPCFFTIKNWLRDIQTLKDAIQC
jgi:hypothetical protein